MIEPPNLWRRGKPRMSEKAEPGMTVEVRIYPVHRGNPPGTLDEWNETCDRIVPGSLARLSVDYGSRYSDGGFFIEARLERAQDLDVLMVEIEHILEALNKVERNDWEAWLRTPEGRAYAAGEARKREAAEEAGKREDLLRRLDQY